MRTRPLSLMFLFGLGVIAPTSLAAAEARIARAAATPVPIARANVAVPAGKQYMIEMKLVRMSEDGKETVAATPRLVVLEGQSASFHAGSEIPWPTAEMGLDEGGYVPLGIRFSAKVVSKKGRLFLDAMAEVSDAKTIFDNVGPAHLDFMALQAVEAISFGKVNTFLLNAAAGVLRIALGGPDGHLVASTSLRVATAVTLGKTIILRVPETKNDRWEIAVHEPQFDKPVATGEKRNTSAATGRTR